MVLAFSTETLWVRGRAVFALRKFGSVGESFFTSSYKELNSVNIFFTSSLEEKSSEIGVELVRLTFFSQTEMLWHVE